MIIEKIEAHCIIPVVAIEDPEDAVPLCKALEHGGLEVAEITFRTDAARLAITKVAKEFPKFALGAGTVTTVEEVEAAVEAGAQFAVAPGLNSKIVKRAQELGLPFFPGVCTPSDIEAALELGCKILKYFPAGAMGGVKMIKALYGPYKHKGIRFIPTGGVNAENLSDYVKQPSVLGVGGTWIAPAATIKAKEWSAVTRTTMSAVRIVEIAKTEQ